MLHTHYRLCELQLQPGMGLHSRCPSFPQAYVCLQSITLQYQMDQTVATADKPPVILARMPNSFVQNVGAALRYDLCKVCTETP